jgi:type III secretion protein C
MMNKKQIFFFLLTACFSQTVFAKNSPPWLTLKEINTSNEKSYYFYFDNDTLRTALIRIAKTFDAKIHFSDEIPDDTLNQMISGRFRVSSPEELFNKFSDNFAISWFFYDGILYVTSNTFVTKNLYVAPDLVSNFKNVLNNDGILNDRFSWSEVPSEGMIVVSGPDDYIKIIEKKMKKLHISPVDQQFALFHLKYANAVDTTVQLGSQQLTIPGVATILKALLQNGQTESSGTNSKLLKQVVEPLKNNLKDILPNSAANLSEAESISNFEKQDRDHLKTTVSSPIIQADNRLNTIIIRDRSNNMGIYKSLIDMLDVPAPLIQIEVMILDVDQVKMAESGVSWWGNNKGGINGGFGGNNLTNAPAAGAPTLVASYGNVAPGNLIINNLATFLASLRFLENKGYAKTESKSAVVTIDNIAAAVNLSETAYPLSTPQTQNSGASAIQTQVEMQVTPHVIYEENNMKKIKLTVALKDGNMQEKTVGGGPTTLQGDLSSQAIVEEGSSLLLAGFTHKQMEQIESKVPVLGDIPVLGWFFKSKNSANKELQRTYLVSPSIVWSDRGKKIPNYSLLNERGTKER